MTLDNDIAVIDPSAPTGAAAPAVAVRWPATSAPPAVILPISREPVAGPALSVVPAGVAIATVVPGQLWTMATAIASVALHGAVVATLLTAATPVPPRIDIPAIEIEMVEPEAEAPPAAAATPQEVTTAQTPPVAIERPALDEMPLPPELLPPDPVAVEQRPVELPAPPEPQATLPDELRPPPVAQNARPTPVVIEPPPLAELPLPAELLPSPPPRQPVAARPRTPPRREAPRQPPSPRQVTVRDAPRQPPAPRLTTPPSAASAGRGVTSQPSVRTASPPPTYLARVMAQLHRAKPAGSGEQGRAVVRFAIQRSGAAGGVSLASSSGNSAIDQAALAMVRRAAPFPPLPAEYGPATMALTVPIAFR